MCHERSVFRHSYNISLRVNVVRFDRPMKLYGILCSLYLSVNPCSADDRYTTWKTYGGDKHQTKYSSLDQINLSNMNRLQVAWRYSTGDAEKQGSQIQCNPIVVGGVLYGTSPKLKVLALNAVTGELIWRFDPFAGISMGQGINRGLSYWQGNADKRILFGAGPYLYALNADNGKIIKTFGENGRVDLRSGLGRKPQEQQIDITTPGIIYKDLIILGSRTGETPGAAPGHIRAYDVKTGRMKWIFHTIPHPGEFGYETWSPDSWQKAGGANAWTGMSLDEKNSIVYVPTGSPSFDFYGGNRVGDNLFANSLVALKADTGERLWHFQTVRHDLWDRDLASPPNLVTVKHNGKLIDAVAQVTKSGFIFLFNRLDGKPLFPIEERRVRKSDVPGEVTSPTQPIPLKPPPFTRQSFTIKDVTDISEQARTHIQAQLTDMRSGEPYIPPTIAQDTIIYPGFDGGAGWGGAAYDPEFNLLYVNATELPWSYELVDITDATFEPGKKLYLKYCASCHGIERQGIVEDYPSLHNVGGKLSYPIIARIIRNGKGRMPGFPQLGFQNILLLLDYLNVTEADATEENRDELPSKIKMDVPYLHTGYKRMLDQNGYPGIKPPWGTLTAIDLNLGVIVWQAPLGEYPELVKQGIRHTGTENYGGPIVTKGGLIFIASTMDEKFRAFNKHTGEVVWEYQLSAGGFATPATYEVDGEQFIVIAAGGGKSGLKSGDEYIAFSLQDDSIGYLKSN